MSINPYLRRAIFLVSGFILIGIGLFFADSGKGMVIGGLPLLFGIFALKEALFPYKKKK